jgi:VIT1/CCC1 family predicted Fe2+/Mn2+ transporter
MKEVCFKQFFFSLEKSIIFVVEIVMKHRWNLWNKTKKFFVRAGKAQKELRRIAVEKAEHRGESGKVKKEIFYSK